MLFSREDVSNYINQNFEPAWEMVRPVPIVRIDFGNGTVSTRTLHGNVASHICSADGNIADILPGIYTPSAYLTALQQPRDLVGTLRTMNPTARLTAWRAYHANKAQLLRNVPVGGPNGARPVRPPDVGKGRIEFRVEQNVAALQEALAAQERLAATRRPRNAAELAAWQPLVADTRLNEGQRRLLIHTRLSTADFTRPEQIKVWLYRDVLHADIEDPTMGLGEDFFADVER